MGLRKQNREVTLATGGAPRCPRNPNRERRVNQCPEASDSVMISSVIPARLEFSCGHAALVSLPRLKGEGASRRTERVTQEKTAARGRPCDFCGPSDQSPLDVHSDQEHALSGQSNGHHVAETKENVTHTTETPRPMTSEPGPETDPTPLTTTVASPSVVRLGADEAKR